MSRYIRLILLLVTIAFAQQCGGGPSSPSGTYSLNLSPLICGNGQCQPGLGENTGTCPQDCVACWGTVTASPGCCVDMNCYDLYGNTCTDDNCCDSTSEDLSCADCARTNLMDGCSGPVDIVADGGHIYAKNNRMIAYGYALDSNDVVIIEPKGFILMPTQQDIPVSDALNHDILVNSYNGFDMGRWGTDTATAQDNVAIANIGVVITAIIDLVGVLPVDISGTSVGFCMNVTDLKTAGEIIYDASQLDAVGVLFNLVEFVSENIDNLAICLWESSVDTAQKEALISGLKGIGKVAGEVTQIYNAYVILGKVAPVLLDLWQATGETNQQYCASVYNVDRGTCPAAPSAGSSPPPPPPPSPTPTPAPREGCDVSTDHFCVDCEEVDAVCTPEWKGTHWLELLTKLEDIYARNPELFRHSGYTFRTYNTSGVVLTCSGYNIYILGSAPSASDLRISISRDAVIDTDLITEIKFTACHELAHKLNATLIDGTDYETQDQLADWFAYVVCGYKSNFIRRYESLSDKTVFCDIDPRLDTTLEDCDVRCADCCFNANDECRGAISKYWADELSSADDNVAVSDTCEGIFDCDVFDKAALFNSSSYALELEAFKRDRLSCFACTDECSSGEVRCTSGRAYSCMLDTSGCWVWDAGTACPSGVCADALRCAGCTTHHHQSCYADDLYWYDSCGIRETMATDCGIDEWTGALSCRSGDVYQNFINRGCVGTSCTTSTTLTKKEDCGTAGCTGGACCDSHTSYRCYSDDVYWYSSCDYRQEKKEDCGTDTAVGSAYCYDNDVYRDYDVVGCTTNRCTTTRERVKQSECGTLGCNPSTRTCCINHDHRSCYSGDVYWYTSCNDRQEIYQDCHVTQTCSTDRCTCAASTPWNSNILTARQVTGGVYLSWQAAPSSWIHHYRVAAAPGSMTPTPGMSISGDLTTTSFTHRSGTPGQRYTYLVYGYDACNNNRNTSTLTQEDFP